MRDADEAAVAGIGPGMIRAGERLGIALVRSAHLHAAMAAAIEEGADLPIFGARDQYRVFAHVGAEEIAGLLELAFVAQEQPAAPEHARQLLLIDVHIDEDTAADQALLRLHQHGVIDRLSGRVVGVEPAHVFASLVLASRRTR